MTNLREIEKINIYQWSKGKEKEKIDYEKINLKENSILQIEIEDEKGKRANITIMFRNLPENLKKEIFNLIYNYLKEKIKN